MEFEKGRNVYKGIIKNNKSLNKTKYEGNKQSTIHNITKGKNYETNIHFVQNVNIAGIM